MGEARRQAPQTESASSAQTRLAASVEAGLAEVRRALGRTSSERPAPLAPFVEDEPAFSTDELLARFIAELSAVGAAVYHAPTAQQVAAHITEICRRPLIDKATGKAAGKQTGAVVGKVALSGAPLLGELRLGELLSAAALQTVASAAFTAADSDGLIAELAECEAGVTAVDVAIAETGTLALSTDEAHALLVSLVPPRHIAVLRPRQLVATLAAAIRFLDAERMNGDKRGGAVCRVATFITGPSRTSDIELKVSIGVHGPVQLHVILLEDRE